MSYHVRTLAELGVIRLERATPRRGAVEHHYRATVRAQREIAARLGINRGTVGRMLAAAHPPRYRRRSQGSKVDPFELVIREVLIEWPQIRSQKHGQLARVAGESAGVPEKDGLSGGRAGGQAGWPGAGARGAP